MWGAVQVPPKSRAALQVNEARLALLLQAVRTSLQAAGALPRPASRWPPWTSPAQLARCQVSASSGLLRAHQKSLLSWHSPCY